MYDSEQVLHAEREDPEYASIETVAMARVHHNPL